MDGYYKTKADVILIWVTSIFGFLFCSIFIISQISHLEIQNQVAQTLQIHSYAQWEKVNLLFINSNRIATISFGLALIVIGLLVIMIGKNLGKSILLKQAYTPFNVHTNLAQKENRPIIDTTENSLISRIEYNSSQAFKPDAYTDYFIKFSTHQNSEWALLIVSDLISNEIKSIKGFCIKDSKLSVLRNLLIGKIFTQEEISLMLHPHFDFKLLNFKEIPQEFGKTNFQYFIVF